MKKKLLEALQTKFEGVDAKILARIADNKANGITDEEQVPSIIDGISFQDVLTSYGDFRAGEASITAVNNYKKKQEAEKQEEPKEEEPKQEVPEWAQSLIDSNKALTDRLQAFEDGKKAETRQASVSAKAKEYGIPETVVSMLSIPEDADLDVYMKDAKQTFANLGMQGLTPPRSGADPKTEAEALAQAITNNTKELKK